MTSSGNIFDDFPENQLTIDFAFLCKPTWGSATVSLFSLVLISFGAMALPLDYINDPSHGTHQHPLLGTDAYD